MLQFSKDYLSIIENNILALLYINLRMLQTNNYIHFNLDDSNT